MANMLAGAPVTVHFQSKGIPMAESKTLTWAELRERVAAIKRHAQDATTYRGLEELLSDIDAAAGAMERQERDAAEWNRWEEKRKSKMWKGTSDAY